MNKLLPILLTLAAVSLPASAQDGKVLKGKEITESALIQALTPVETIRTRSFRRDQPVVPVKPASASLLLTFETNSADLSKAARDSLDTVGRALKSDRLAEFKFDIEGHADPRGGPDLNQHLSQARADAVRQYLVQNHQVGEQRLKAIGKGDTELLNEKNPVAPENRRVTIKTVVE